jgi:ribosomal protein L11 methyltransferase
MNQSQPERSIRVEILVKKGQEELLSDDLYKLSGRGFWLEDQGELVLLKCYPDNPYAFLQYLPLSGLEIANVTVEQEVPKDYAELTRQYFRPIRIGDLIIRAPWNKKRGNGREIIIEPGMAFGTGRHESTRIMIKLMNVVVFKGKTVLDIGCGSGILALYAHLLGAGKIIAVDNDLDAVFNAKKNTALNRADNIDLICANIQDIRVAFDVVLANLDIKTFSAYSPRFFDLLHQKGRLIVSGILNKEKDHFLSLFREWVLLDICRKNAWSGFLLQKADMPCSVCKF